MNLPKSIVPSEEVTLPFSKKTLSIRAMTTKEERMLLLAKESSENTLENSIKILCEGCTYNDININEFDAVDIVFIFLKILELSKGLIEHHEYTCKNEVINDNGETEICKNKIKKTLDLSTVVYKNIDASDIIELGDNINIQIKYPTMADINEYKSNTEDKQTDKNIKFYSNCIVSIIQGEELYNDFTKNEIFEWVLDLPLAWMEKIVNRIDNPPTAYLEYELTCDKCGYNEIHKIEGLTGFFSNRIPV